jgi:electron transport complex protein RnfC
MIAKSFFGFGKPRIEYSRLAAKPVRAELVSPASRVTLLHPAPARPRPASGLKIGEPVKIGQKISLYGESGGYVIAPVAGKVEGLSNRPGDYGQGFTAVTIAVNGAADLDEGFAEAARTPALETARASLAALPGRPPLERLGSADHPLRTLVVCGVDQDLLVLTQQYALKAYWREVCRGIDVLKAIGGFEEAVILTPKETLQGYGHIGARVAGVDHRYPSAQPALVMSEVFGREVPAGQSPEDLGFCFMSAEAAAAVGRAYGEGRIPVNKIVTVIPKDGLGRLVEAPIGTPIGELLAKFGAAVQPGDRLVLGGPMRGAAAYSPDHPVQPDTDAVMLLDAARASETSDYPCTNCGECVRICPARMQVNLLVCYLEAGKYAEAADGYDLFSCLECGLCSYVCVSKIPIFQYITLAKYELARARTLEAANA